MRAPPPLPDRCPEAFTVTVHGTCFGGREQLLDDLEPGDQLALVADPPVQEEPEVWVHLPSGRPVGHLPPEVNSWLAPWLQRGGGARARALRVHGPEAPSWRRLVIEVVTSAKALGCLLVGLAVGTAACSGADADRTDLDRRQAEVAQSGSLVMPFDLERSTHIFEKLDDGGRQTVVADTDDGEQVALIRAHLATEAEQFARGNFHDPEMIHGSDMAGMHTLVTGHEHIEISYADVERGAQIRYSSGDPELVAAIHLWFDAQLRDHGDHAEAHR